MERRAHPRLATDEVAELVIPSEEMLLPCRVLNISQGGAGIECDVIPQAGTKVVLVMKDGRHFESVTAWYKCGELRLRFTGGASHQADPRLLPYRRERLPPLVSLTVAGHFPAPCFT